VGKSSGGKQCVGAKGEKVVEKVGKNGGKVGKMGEKVGKSRGLLFANKLRAQNKMSLSLGEPKGEEDRLHLVLCPFVVLPSSFFFSLPLLLLLLRRQRSQSRPISIGAPFPCSK